MWERLSPEGAQVVRYAYMEAREFGHQLGRYPWTYPYIGDEHVLLGILRHGQGPAAELLRSHGLDPETTRQRLHTIEPTLQPHVDAADALRGLGVDIDALRQRLETTFGADTVQTAERRVRRRPWWRGGRTRWARPCTFLLAKRALDFAGQIARHDTGQHPSQPKAAGIGPEHLLYGVLRDALDPVGTQLSRRTRRQLAEYGWRPGRPNPLRLLLECSNLDAAHLRTALCADRGWPTR